MDRVTVSSKYQVVIPKGVRRKLKVKPGEMLTVFIKGDTISLVCDRPLESLRGIMRGVSTKGLREKKDRDL
jgi:AbrB family looped-hinge helix DNA binding protein